MRDISKGFLIGSDQHESSKKRMQAISSTMQHCLPPLFKSASKSDVLLGAGNVTRKATQKGFSFSQVQVPRNTVNQALDEEMIEASSKIKTKKNTSPAKLMRTSSPLKNMRTVRDISRTSGSVSGSASANKLS